MTLSIVILAAGQGKRMHSDTPKVLHPLGGKPLLEHVINTATELKVKQPIIIYGHQGGLVRHRLAHLDAVWVEQTAQLGTGHALQQALPHLPADQRVLVLYSDVPLITSSTLQKFIEATPTDALGIITAVFCSGEGFGRIIRDQDRIIKIVEEKDATDKERLIQEVNSGIYLFPAHFLAKHLMQLTAHNNQQEYYLTDMIHLAVKENIPVHGFKVNNSMEVAGINDRSQLGNAERYYQFRNAEKLMQQGVTIYDSMRLSVRGPLTIGRDVVIDVNVITEGNVTIGNNCIIGPNTILRNVVLGNNVEIKAMSVVDGAEIADGCTVGPFARIRPGTVLASDVRVGNFVEIKNSFIDNASKVPHLSYVGDSDIGKKVNIGAGTITCNYDGMNKHRTLIGDGAFIGSDSQLVAPVTIGAGATIGAGSTITRDAPPNQLTLCRAEQRTIKNWQRPKKKEMEKE